MNNKNTLKIKKILINFIKNLFSIICAYILFILIFIAIIYITSKLTMIPYIIKSTLLAIIFYTLLTKFQ